MDRRTKTRATSLAELARTQTKVTPIGALAALRESQEREELRALYVGMVPTGRRTLLGAQRWRFDDSVVGKRNPCADLVADARAALRQAKATPAQVLAPFERMLELLRAECGAATPELPALDALDYAETAAQGAADLAMRAYCNARHTAPRQQASFGARAIQKVNDHLSALGRLRDRLRHEHVLVLHGLRSARVVRGTLETGR